MARRPGGGVAPGEPGATYLLVREYGTSMWGSPCRTPVRLTFYFVFVLWVHNGPGRSEESKFMTGSELVMDGGYTAQ